MRNRIGFDRKGNEPIFYDIDRKKLEDMQKQGFTVVETIPGTRAINHGVERQGYKSIEIQ